MPKYKRYTINLALLYFSFACFFNNIGFACAKNQVYFNINSGKYHKISCIHATRCTKNCICVNKSRAKETGVPCKVCGG